MDYPDALVRPIARAIHDAQWEDRFDGLSPDSIQRDMACRQAVAALDELRRIVGSVAEFQNIGQQIKAPKPQPPSSEDGK